MQKKIVFVTPGVGTGGAEKQLATLARGLMARHFEVAIISLSESPESEILPDFNTLRTIHYDFVLGSKLHYSILGLRSILSEEKPDIVQGWMYAGNIAASLSSIGICRSVYHSVRASNMDNARYGMQIRMNAILSHTSVYTAANSQSGLDFHVARRFSRKNMRLIPNGIDNKKFQPDQTSRKMLREELGIGQHEFTVSYAARVDPMKAHELLVSSARLCPEIKFIFVGLGTDRLSLPENAMGLGLRTDMPTIFNASDWVINWSHYGEGFPNVIGEAMACGVPVIANNIGDSWFLMDDTGFKSAATSPQEIARDLRALGKKQLSRRSKARVKKRIDDNFTVERMVDAYVSLYQ